MAEEKLRRFDDMGRIMMPPNILEEVFGTKDVFYKAVTVSVNKKGQIVLTPQEETRTSKSKK